MISRGGKRELGRGEAMASQPLELGSKWGEKETSPVRCAANRGHSASSAYTSTVRCGHHNHHAVCNTVPLCKLRQVDMEHVDCDTHGAA